MGVDEAAIEAQQPAQDPLLQATAPDRVVEAEGLGLPVRVETNDARVEAAARDLFGPPPETPSAEALVTLRILVHDVPEEPGWTPTQPVMRAQGSAFYVAASRASVVSGDTERGFAFGFISHRQADHAEHLRSTLILGPFSWIAMARALSPVHCAVVRLNGTTLLLRGEQGAGKTTLAYAALRQGFSLLCEDVAFAWGAEDGIELRGLPRQLYLLPDATRFFPELDGLEPVERFNGETKLLVSVAEPCPGQAITRAPLGPTVFVERSPEGRNQIEELGREEALARFDATRIPVERRRAGEVDIWGAMLAHGAWRFEVGPDPLAAAAALAEHCG